MKQTLRCALFLLLSGCEPAVDQTQQSSGGLMPPLLCPPGREQHGERCLVKEIYFEGGTFTMGRGECFPVEAHAADFGLEEGVCEISDEPHQVTLAPFYMDATEFVAGDSPGFLSDGKCPTMEQTEACLAAGALRAFRVDEVISEDDAESTIKKMEGHCKRFGKVLPTEAQWEFVASAGGTRLYPWGDDPPTCTRVTPFDGYDDQCGFEGPPSPGKYPPSVEGLYDLAGSLAEIVKTDSGMNPPGYPPLPVVTSPVEHWVGVRGGSLFESTRTLRAAHRGTGARYGVHTGFRCVRNP